MAARISAAMERAIERIVKGETAYSAAKAEGVTATGIRRSPQYLALLVAGRVNFGKAGRKNTK